MAEAGDESLWAVWRRLRDHNEWQLVDDERAFLERAAAIAATLQAPNSGTNQFKKVLLMRAYGEVMHAGLLARNERAAQEIWLAFRRTALSRGDMAPEVAEEQAQEAVLRVLNTLPILRSPQSLIFWAFRIFSSVVRERAEVEQKALKATDATLDEEIADPQDMSALVEQRMVDARLLALLEAKLSNLLERTVVLRVVALGEHPRDVARDLGLPLHRTRLAKSRAIKRLRGDHELLRLLQELSDDADIQRSRGGGDDEPGS